ncbi:activating signal cointegrator 1 complex subunit 2 isoform X2 [Calliopsis andreniformis]|uniref:activating signal cointegrator 1 complex subunit 2 isoform X2 n=1 Tax=Calliopsis andreniformis TaxID=337506 RepID=UPI003FCED988
MTENVLHSNMEPFENLDLLPLEKLKLKIKTDGVSKIVDALNEVWAEKRYFLHYEAPVIYSDDGSEIMGAKEHWMEIVSYMINDLKWLLNLPFYRFWSNIVYNTSIVDALASFLQEAPPFYALESFPNCPEMLESLETLRRYVLVVFTRLVTNKQSPAEYMTHQHMGNLLYDNYIFTIPIIFDLCQLYGRENEKVIERMLRCLFTLESRYNNDLQKTVPCLIEAFKTIERKFNTCSSHNTDKAISLSEWTAGPTNLTLLDLEDTILYVLDISSTLTVFLKNYPPAVEIFHKEDFMNVIVSIYETTIPEMYKKLDTFSENEENVPKYMEVKHRLDVTRIEILGLSHVIIYEPIQNIQDNLGTLSESEIKEKVEEYLTFLTNVIGEKEFITDYDQFYPVQSDLDLLSDIYHEIDTMKCEYILKSISATTGKANVSSVSSNNVDEAIAGPSNAPSQSMVFSNNTCSSNEKHTTKDFVELLISKVKDIFFKLDDHFIECLEYYNYNTDSVINAILEENLPPNLEKLKNTKPIVDDILPDYTETLDDEDVTLGFKQLDIHNNFDDVPIKSREVIEVSKDYITRNYSLIDDYEDELDDTFDNHVIPRVLLGKQKTEVADESESDDDDTEVEQNGKDHFIPNPAELRAKAEQRRQANRNGKTSADVIGKPRGQGQDKKVMHNRQQKNTNKAQHANHNRRSGAQRKRNQGMIPS